MTDETLFISDCHLDAGRPEVSESLCLFLRQRAIEARCLYILGDLFEVWLGDDDSSLEQSSVMMALQQLAATTQIYFMAGNRDFLLGNEFAARVGISIITEPVTIELDGEPVLLIHGDTLCTDDHDYQAFRNMVREPQWQAEFLARPLVERQQIAAGLRRDSISAMADKTMDIMDVNQQAVQQCFDDQKVRTIIHGHTHRPGVHHYPQNCTRYVLGDWNPDPSFLSWRSDLGFKLADSRIH